MALCSMGKWFRVSGPEFRFFYSGLRFLKDETKFHLYLSSDPGT